MSDAMEEFEEIKQLVIDCLNISDRKNTIKFESRIVGGMPEFDSMAVVVLLEAIEKKYGIEIDDDEIVTETFATMGTLTRFVQEKLAGK